MDRRLTTEEVNVLRTMRDINAGISKVPSHLAPKLRMLGYVAVHGGSGQYALTIKGRDELIDRERDAARLN
jgi:hypothetical protein